MINLITLGGRGLVLKALQCNTSHFHLIVKLLFVFCSGPVMALCLAKEDAVEGWRSLLGPKEIDIAKAEAPERYASLKPVLQYQSFCDHGRELCTGKF